MLSALWQKWLYLPSPAAPVPPGRAAVLPAASGGVGGSAGSGGGADGQHHRRRQLPTVLSLRQAIRAVDSQSTAVLTPQQRQQVSGSLGDKDRIQFAPGLFRHHQASTGRAEHHKQ